MDPFIQECIEQQALEKAYWLMGVEVDRLWFSIDDTENASSREHLEWCATERMPPDFTAASMDPRYIGDIAEGWKSGSMMLVCLTTLGRNFRPMTDDEYRERERMAFDPKTPEELEDADAIISELMTGTETPRSKEAKERHRRQIEREMSDLSHLRRVELWDPSKRPN